MNQAVQTEVSCVRLQMKSADPGTEAVGEYWARRLQGPVLDKPRHLSVKPGRV